MKSLRILPTVALVIGLVGLLASCGSEPEPPGPEPPAPGAPQPAAQPNLAVASVQVHPSQPRAGQQFTVSVYVTNKGNAVSGDFDLAMNIRDVSRGSTYPVGTYRQGALQPGDQVPWQSGNLMVNESGEHQFWVEIAPFLFQDGNQQDNTYRWSFQVTP